MQNRSPILEEHKLDFPALTPGREGLWVLGWHCASPGWDEPMAALSSSSVCVSSWGSFGLGTTRSSSPVVSQHKCRRECGCWGGTGSTVVLRPGTVGCCTVLGSTWGCPHSGTRMRWMEHTHSLEGSWARGSLLHAQHRAMRRDGVPGGAPLGLPAVLTQWHLLKAFQAQTISTSSAPAQKARQPIPVGPDGCYYIYL